MSVLDLFRLDGKTALVSGCRRGSGLGFACALAEAGSDIVGVSASMESSGSEVEKRVRAAGRSFGGYQCEFSDRDSVYRFLDQLRSDGRQIDILVNNAGTIEREPAEVHSDESWDRVIDVNLSTQFVLSREIGGQMLERGSGKISFTASLLSYQGGITVPGYAASKGGIAQLTMALANEWAGKGVNVNAIAPGYVATDNNLQIRSDPERYQAILERIPAGRWGEPDDLMGAVVFLASRASDYVHGQLLLVDGGWMGR